MNQKERQSLERLLLQRTKQYKPELDSMLQRMSEHWTYEDRCIGSIIKIFDERFQFVFLQP
ncbi:MAG: hypothetical protein L0Z53_17825 [Acidobacteriales bacterium]|nr:hypothetical protein [Terriglobales bacterium]